MSELNIEIHMQGKILIVAGSDSGGGAGVQADIKTVTVLGGYAMTAITALTAQNTRGVYDVMPVDAAFISLQMDLVLNDLGADVIKTGMLYSAEVVEAVADMLALYPKIPCVVDPVMVSTSGNKLLQEEALTKIRETLLPRSFMVTPNIPEAELLAGMRIKSRDDMQKAAEKIKTYGPEYVLIKGGHGKGDAMVDMLLGPKGLTLYERPRINTKHTHGTGCTMASAISTFIAQQKKPEEAVKMAGDYVAGAIKHAPGFGHGYGPLNHGYCIHLDKELD